MANFKHEAVVVSEIDYNKLPRPYRDRWTATADAPTTTVIIDKNDNWQFAPLVTVTNIPATPIVAPEVK